MVYRLWFDGQWTETRGGGRLSVQNPANGQKIAEVVDATQEDVAVAVESAKKAFYDGRWSRRSPAERSNILWRLAGLLEKHSEELARVESENTGKPYRLASLGTDMPFIVDNLRYFAAAARDTHGLRAGEYLAGYTSMCRREPVGVVGQITPWNYPLMMAVWKTGPALAAGCSVVLRPSRITPLTTLMFAQLSAEAGLPPGVLNVVTGSSETGEAIVEHPNVRMISITGSTAVGQRVMEVAAKRVKRVHLELGGKAPVLVFDDADAELVASKVTLASTYNSGQDCTAATRLYVQKGLFESVKDAVVETMRKVKVGPPFEDTTEMGPLISKAHRERVHGFVERALGQGANILTGGRHSTTFGEGYYYEPTVIADPAQGSEIVQAEVFGPVVTIQPFETEADAIRMANDVRFGLASSIFTQDLGRVMRVSSKLEYGVVWVNDHMVFASEMPHGGFKESGFGKDLSTEAVQDYLITKHVMMAH